MFQGFYIYYLYVFYLIFLLTYILFNVYNNHVLAVVHLKLSFREVLYFSKSYKYGSHEMCPADLVKQGA